MLESEWSEGVYYFHETAQIGPAVRDLNMNVLVLMVFL